MAEDGWMWGNHRGGGGAPLKSSDGETITNLRKVFHGDVRVDYSPSNSPSKQSNANVPRRGNAYDSDDSDYDDRRGRRDRKKPADVESPANRKNFREITSGISLSEKEAKIKYENLDAPLILFYCCIIVFVFLLDQERNGISRVFETTNRREEQRKRKREKKTGRRKRKRIEILFEVPLSRKYSYVP